MLSKTVADDIHFFFQFSEKIIHVFGISCKPSAILLYALSQPTFSLKLKEEEEEQQQQEQKEQENPHFPSKKKKKKKKKEWFLNILMITGVTFSIIKGSSGTET